MALGLFLLQVLASLYYNLERIHFNIIQMEYQFDQSSYVFYRMNYYSRLAGYNSQHALGLDDLSEGFISKLKEHIRYKPNNWIAFRFRLPSADQYKNVYSCEGSLLQWGNNVAVTEEILVVFWFSKTSNTLTCKTWVKNEKEHLWCELPIDTGICSQFRVNSQSLLNNIKHLSFVFDNLSFEITMSLKSQYPNKYSHYQSQWVILKNQRLYPFQE